MDEKYRIPLSKLAETLITKADGRRDREFVRNFSEWFQENSEKISFEIVEDLKLEDVTVTFIMKDEVKLVITGYYGNFPGEITIRASERDFPFVFLNIHKQGIEKSYTFCTIDYSVRGMNVVLNKDFKNYKKGEEFEVVVYTTIGKDRHFRVNPRNPFNIPEEYCELLVNRE